MIKVYGSPKRQDCLTKVGLHTYELIYGFGKDDTSDETGYNWRERFNHVPTTAEIKECIENQINANTAEIILTGMKWNGKPVWLSTENQINLKAAYDLARETDGENLPKKFKLGEDENGAPVYHTFTKIEAFSDFIKKMVEHISTAVNMGYEEKDSVDYSKFNLQ
ncbi:MAG: hypothetical protein HDR09_21630 [Lachnospiraceae bacterium]|nr:hypothetical protein [Lachnospiraceae bacterium]